MVYDLGVTGYVYKWILAIVNLIKPVEAVQRINKIYSVIAKLFGSLHFISNICLCFYPTKVFILYEYFRLSSLS